MEQFCCVIIIPLRLRAEGLLLSEEDKRRVVSYIYTILSIKVYNYPDVSGVVTVQLIYNLMVTCEEIRNIIY